MLCALFNSFPFDWLVRQKAATHLSLYLLDGLPFPSLPAEAQEFLANAAAALSADRPGYEDLRRERARCDGLPANAAQRSVLRARVDAVVAKSYGLTRLQYEHLLASFSHRSFPDAPSLCLEAFAAFDP